VDLQRKDLDGIEVRLQNRHRSGRDPRWGALEMEALHASKTAKPSLWQTSTRPRTFQHTAIFRNSQQAMQPQKPKMQVLEERFGRVESLDFCRCEQLRNRNLNTLAASKKLVISHISIGHLLLGQSHIKPRITNKVWLTRHRTDRGNPPICRLCFCFLAF
jgi:hypothetical protein